MGIQKIFKLKGRNTKETINENDVESEIIIYRYENDINGAILTIKGTINAVNLGLPTETLNDEVTLEFGATQKQTKIDTEITIVGREKIQKHIKEKAETLGIYNGPTLDKDMASEEKKTNGSSLGRGGRGKKKKGKE